MIDRIKDFTETEFRKYFETRFQNQRLKKSGIGFMALCLLHEERTPSCSINMEKGVWNCHGCGRSGGLIDLERALDPSIDDATAIARISDIVGIPQMKIGGTQPEAVYRYLDAQGKDVFEVVRFPGKKFLQRKRDEKGGWDYKTSDLKMLLYNLPRLIQAREIVVCEGEKDCDRINALLAEAKIVSVAATTSPRGAGKWHDHFAPYFCGKKVIVVADKDEPGRKHALRICESIYRFAYGVKLVELPGDDVKDVSDYLKERTFVELAAEFSKAPQWRPPEGTEGLFMTVTEFESRSAPALEWLVEGVMQRGANGLIIARPKCGKSLMVLDLAVALASGMNWMGFHIPKRVKVALVSREDTYGLTQWRLRKLRKSRGQTTQELDGWLYVNAKGLKPKIMLDYPDEVARLISDLKRHGSEFLILDVMRVLHSQEENDNTDMQKVIDVLNRIQEEAGCSICLIHHDNKREDATLTERIRGASAIAGYAEFICGIRLVDDTDLTREFACELKACMPPDKFYWRILDMIDDGIKLERVVWSPPDKRRSKKLPEAADQTSFEPGELG